MKNGVESINTYSRQIGMGAAPAGVGNPLDVLSCGFTQVPVIEYVTWTVSLPITDDQISATFGDEIDVLQNQRSVQGVASVDSSFVMNGLLQTDMLVIGFGIHIFGEPFSFTQIGNAIPVTSTTPIWSPDAFTVNDLANGALGPTSNIVPATIEWGFPAWEAGWELANAYQFQWIMQQRYLLINELAADVCYFGPYAEAVAAGTSDVSVQQYARSVNDRYRTLSSTSLFQPVNARRVGSVTDTVNVGIFHATRDFDLAPVTHGGLRNQGGFANGQPFRKLLRPVLLEKGIPIGMKLVVQDTVHQKAMQQYMSISESAGGTSALVSFDSIVNGNTTTGATVGIEQTVDTTPILVSQQTNTDRVIFKGGTMKLAILIKGFEVWGDWKQFIVSNWKQFVQMPGR